MSKSKARLKSTKAGVALSADARNKLQQLADWVEREELLGQQDPMVRLTFAQPVMSLDGVTRVNVFGALCQMFQPFRLSEARRLTYGTYSMGWDAPHYRAAGILGINRTDFQLLMRFCYAEGARPLAIVKQLRKLK